MYMCSVQNWEVYTSFTFDEMCFFLFFTKSKYLEHFKTLLYLDIVPYCYLSIVVEIGHFTP